MNEALAPWHNFYSLLGEASATLVALLFVAASVGTGVFSRDRLGALRMFLSASVVHFRSGRAVSLVILAPMRSWGGLGRGVRACGLYGWGYTGVAWRAAARDGIIAKIGLEDRVWYVAIPAAAYLAEAADGVAVACRAGWAFAALALVTATLLFAGIHNAWDITVWSTTRQRE